MAYAGPKWPLSEDIDRKQSPHHEALFSLLGCYNGAGLLREEFAQRIAKIKRDPFLTVPGQRDAIAKLVKELRTHESFMRFGRVIAREEERAKAIKSRLTKTVAPVSDKPMSAAEMRQELLRDRTIREFRAHTTEERTKIVRAAMDSGDMNF